jgi:hypothetical protein
VIAAQYASVPFLDAAFAVWLKAVDLDPMTPSVFASNL